MFELLLQLWPASLTTQALAVSVIAGVTAYLLLKRRYKMPPGPRGWPIIGNLLDFRKENMSMVIHKWTRKYGPVMTVKLGILDAVVLSRIDVVLAAMVKRQADFAGRPYSYLGHTVTKGGKDISAATYGPRWKLHRKLASKAIRQYLTSESFNERLSRSVSISTELMRNKVGPFDPYPYLTLTVFNILYGMCFGKLCLDTDDDRFTSYMHNVDVYFKELSGGFLEDVLPPLRLCPTPKFRRACKAFSALEDAIMNELVDHRETYTPVKSRDLTDAILLAQKEAEEEEDPELLAQITDTHVAMTIADIFFAGIDTSRNTLHWTLLALALHPDIQKKVQEEVDSVIGPDLNLRLADRESLPYTDAVLHETMRIRTILPLGLPHETLRETTVGGFTLPKGTAVFISHYSLHFDSDQWNNVDEFRPERFLDASGKMAPKPDSWLPFSAGRRVCLGESLAKPELHLILAGIIRACAVSLASGETHDFQPDGEIHHHSSSGKVLKCRPFQNWKGFERPSFSEFPVGNSGKDDLAKPFQSWNDDLVYWDGWQLVFRAQSDIGTSVYSTWMDDGIYHDGPLSSLKPGCLSLNTSLPCDAHYKSKVVTKWTMSDVQKVRVLLLKGSLIRQEITFDGTGSSKTSWFSPNRVVNSTWIDLTSVTFTFFSIQGHPNTRRFFINEIYAGCNGDRSWMMVVDGNDHSHPCSYDNPSSIPKIMYTTNNRSTEIDNLANFDFGDAMAILVK